MGTPKFTASENPKRVSDALPESEHDIMLVDSLNYWTIIGGQGQGVSKMARRPHIDVSLYACHISCRWEAYSWEELIGDTLVTTHVINKKLSRITPPWLPHWWNPVDPSSCIIAYGFSANKNNILPTHACNSAWPSSWVCAAAPRSYSEPLKIELEAFRA